MSEDEFMSNQAQNNGSARLRHSAALLTFAVAATGLTGLSNANGFTGMRASVPAAPHVQLAQAKQAPTPRLIVDVAVQGRPGDKVKIPARLEPAGADTSQFVMLYQVPAWLKVVGGEAVGNGVWLVPARALGTIELSFEAGATGRQEIVVSLLGANGSDVQSESKLLVNVAVSAAPAGAAKTWQSLVGQPGNTPTATPPTATKTAQVAPKSAVPPSVGNEAELVQYARHLVRECTTCHSLFGTDSGIPVMVGLPRDRFIDTMGLYRTGRRDHGPMKAVAEALDDRDTLALALYLGRIRPAPPTPSAALPASTTLPASITSGTSSGTSSLPAATPITLAKRGQIDKPERLDRWVKRGQELLKAGEVAQARLMFERAAEYGNPLGAYLLGTSYDPNVLPWRPGMGLEAEPGRARDWYVFAKSLGSIPEADQRLADLR
jgi:cytochrome c553